MDKERIVIYLMSQGKVTEKQRFQGTDNKASKERKIITMLNDILIS